VKPSQDGENTKEHTWEGPKWGTSAPNCPHLVCGVELDPHELSGIVRFHLEADGW
jgi:hypothetical protein